MPGQSVLSETVVKLSTQIDNSGVQRLLSLLESNRVKALALSAAFTGLTTAVYKFIESTTKQEYELQKLSKQQHKSIEQTRAETTALKAMGMTLNDIKKDAALKSMYDELVKFNKEMQMPNMARALENVNKLRLEFYKLKSALTYALQSIGAQVLTNLEMPMNRIGGKLKTAATWIKDNMVNITSKVSSFITAFAKGIIAIAETFTKVTDLIGQLPDGIKAIGLAIAAVFLTLKSGPLGQIIAVVSAIGDLMHDYEVYQWNKQNAENPQVYAADNESGYTKDPNDPKAKKLFGKAIPFQQKVGLSWAWEILDSDASTEDKVGSIATNLLEKITAGLNEAFRGFDMSDIFGDGSEEGGGIIGAVINWFKDENNQTVLSNLGEALIGFVERAVRTVGGTAGGAAAKILDSIFGSDALNDIVSDVDGSAGATFAGTITGFITGVIEKIQSGGTLKEAFAGGVGKGLLGAVLSAIMANSTNENGEFEIQWPAVLNDLKVSGDSVLKVFTKLFENVEDLGGLIFQALADAIKNVGTGVFGKDTNALSSLSDAIAVLGADDGVLGKAVTDGIAAWFTTGNGLVGFITAIAKAISTVVNDPSKMETLQKELTDVGTHLVEFLFGGEKEGVHFEGIFETLWTALSGLWEKIAPYLEPLKTGLINFFNGIFDSLTASLGAALSEGYIYFYNHFLRGGPLAGLFPDPNHANIEGNESDGYYLTNTANEGEKTLLTPEQAKVLAPFLGLMSPEGDEQYSFTGEAGVYNSMGFPYESGFLGIPTVKTGKDFLNGLISGEISPEKFLSSFASAIKWEEINGYNPESSENLGKNENNTNQTPKETKQPEPTGFFQQEDWKDEDWNTLLFEKQGENTGKVPQPMATVASAGMSDSTTRRKMAESSESFDGLTKSTEEVADSHDDYLKVLEKVQEESKKATEKTETLGDTFGQLQIDSDTTKTKVTDLGTESETATPKITELGNAGSEAATKLRLAGETGDVSSSRMETAAGRAEGAAARFEAAAASAGAKPGKAWGGRIGSRGEYTVGEDGAEYIIPITKPERAFQLINQMLSEMGSSAIRRVMEGFGIGESGSIGASPASMASALQGMTMANTYNISAPVNINVNATGGSSREIGTSIYDAAERHLIKTLRGVCA